MGDETNNGNGSTSILGDAPSAPSGGASGVSAPEGGNGEWSSLEAMTQEGLAGLGSNGRGGRDDSAGAPLGATSRQSAAGAPLGAPPHPAEAPAGAGAMPGQTGRIFDGLNPEDIPHFKRMSNEAYAYLYPLFKGLRNGDYVPKGEIDKIRIEQRSWNTPEGYVYNPQFGKLNKGVEAHKDYSEYLIGVLNQPDGATVPQLAMDENFEFANVGELTLSPGIRARLQRELALSDSQQAKLSQDLNALRENHLSNVNTFTGSIKGLHEQIITGYGDHPRFKALYEETFNNIIPDELKHAPEMGLLVASLVTSNLIAEHAGQLQAQLKKFQNHAAGATALPVTTSGGTAGSSADWNALDKMFG